MGVSLSLHGVRKFELERTSISVIKEDRLPYEVWNLYILHGDDEKREHFSISLFMVKNQSLKLDEMNTANLHPDHPPVYKFGIHDGIGDPEDPEDRKILEEILYRVRRMELVEYGDALCAETARPGES